MAATWASYLTAGAALGAVVNRHARAVAPDEIIAVDAVEEIRIGLEQRRKCGGAVVGRSGAGHECDQQRQGEGCQLGHGRFVMGRYSWAAYLGGV